MVRPIYGTGGKKEDGALPWSTGKRRFGEDVGRVCSGLSETHLTRKTQTGSDKPLTGLGRKGQAFIEDGVANRGSSRGFWAGLTNLLLLLRDEVSWTS